MQQFVCLNWYYLSSQTYSTCVHEPIYLGGQKYSSFVPELIYMGCQTCSNLCA